jgi:hypothetical protein
MNRFLLGVAVMLLFYGHIAEFIPTIYPIFNAHPAMLIFPIIAFTEIFYHVLTVKEPHEA